MAAFLTDRSSTGGTRRAAAGGGLRHALAWGLAAMLAWTVADVTAAPAQALKEGDKAPDFELPIQGQGGYVTLSKLVADGPVVVVVLRGYPGYQCPLCRRQVSSLINRAAALQRALGDQPQRVVLVYPGAENDLERRAGRFLGSRRLPSPFVLVRDPGMEMVSRWGLRWDAPRETAYPSAYLIGPGRRVRWRKVSESHAGRAGVQEILRAIRKL